VSYLFWERMRESLIKVGTLGCVNFHPAPLPDYKSRAGYNTAILDGKSEFGVSAHFVDSEQFDAGPIIKVLRFPIDPQRETVLSLEPKAQHKLYELYEQVMMMFASGEPISTTPNEGGLYLTAKELEALKEVVSTDSPEVVSRKIRAFFYPPYQGAYVVRDGVKYTLLDDAMLRAIVEHLKR
jgi:methionyl-tRNA formyltransferase